jgi:tetratricopeptide (TPR) repeat protein
MASGSTGKVLLIAWAGADLKIARPLIDAGRMPNLKRLLDEGASGSLTSLQPMVPAVTWTSAATGKRPAKHGVHGAAEIRPDGAGVRAATSTGRATRALWNILTRNGLRTCCVDWPASHPAEPVNGVCVTDAYAVPPRAPGAAWPPPAGAVHPPELRDPLAALRTRPEDIDPSALRACIPGAARIDQDTDHRLATCAASLASAAAAHAAATWCLEHRPWDVAMLFYGGIERFCDAFLPYHPPGLTHVGDDDFSLYRGVVSAAYGFHDMMLGRLLQLAGNDLTVLLVSDHGYHTGARRLNHPARMAEEAQASYRAQGFCVMHGPRVRRGAAIQGTLLDVAPTVLAMLGVPIGGDMDGRPWADAIEGPVEVDRVMSWDAAPGDAGQHPAEARVTAADSAEAIRHLLELGYVEPNAPHVRAVLDRTADDNQFNLARSLADAGQVERAIPLLEALVRRRPERGAYGRALFEAYFSAGRNADCRRLAQSAWDAGRRGPLIHLALGAVEMADRHAEAALHHLKQAEAADATMPGLHVLIGRAYARLQRWADAERAFARAAELDPDSDTAWHGLATAELGLAKFKAAAEHARRAIALRPNYPEAHYHLGVALARLGRAPDAAAALRQSVALRPDLLAAYARMVELYDGPLSDPAAARECKRRADEIILRRRLRRRPAPGASAPASGAAGSRPGG